MVFATRNSFTDPAYNLQGVGENWALFGFIECTLSAPIQGWLRQKHITATHFNMLETQKIDNNITRDVESSSTINENSRRRNCNQRST